MDESTDRDLLGRLWGELEGAPELLERVSLVGPTHVLPSVYDVTALASASVALATLAVSELYASRTACEPRRIVVDRRHAAAAFRSERYLGAVGWSLPPAWDPLAGDYATRDGFIRLHTNYMHHRRAVERVLDGACEREAAARAVARWDAEALEQAVVHEGGCAAMCRTPEAWQTHPQGQSLSHEPSFAIAERVALANPAGALQQALRAPLAGIRVLDLTRVLAGPTCTRFLASYGAEVLRIDPPGFNEVEALLGDTTWGKRRAVLDLRAPSDRARFEQLLAASDVLVHGYRPDALRRLGFGPDERARLNPALIDVSLAAYGWSGPWAERRGFDSLVQMSCGIAAHGQRTAGAPKPLPLPAQALDHATGYLMAAAAVRALARLHGAGVASTVRLSLAGTARTLMSLGDAHDPHTAELSEQDAAGFCEEVDSQFGRLRRVRCPGSIEGFGSLVMLPAGPLGSDEPSFRAPR